MLGNVEQARQSSARVLAPLDGLTGEQRSQIVTRPPTIGSLTEVEELRLYGSHLVRLPPEIGGMSALRYLDVYTSHRLHFAPYELSRCRALKDSRVSTRVLYGNYKNRGLFPHLKLPENARELELTRPKTCSVCDVAFGDRTPVARWITLRLGTDWWPLLVHACSGSCIEQLPQPPEGYVDHPHTGGHHVKQPPTRYWRVTSSTTGEASGAVAHAISAMLALLTVGCGASTSSDGARGAAPCPTGPTLAGAEVAAVRALSATDDIGPGQLAAEHASCTADTARGRVTLHYRPCHRAQLLAPGAGRQHGL